MALTWKKKGKKSNTNEYSTVTVITQIMYQAFTGTLLNETGLKLEPVLPPATSFSGCNVSYCCKNFRLELPQE